MTDRMESFIDSANTADTQFPLNNLPYGVFSTDAKKRCGVAIGDYILDISALESNATIAFDSKLFQSGSWNALMAAGQPVWDNFRQQLFKLLSVNGAQREAVQAALLPQSSAELHMPFDVCEFTDFYSSRNHATNVGTMLRGPENALSPNWLHMPIGYNGRASSVVISGTDISRPRGQIKGANYEIPQHNSSRRFDIELEVGAIVGTPSRGAISVQQADDNIFGYVLLNDWSARDIQAWEYQPLGPFQAKATATTISPWIVTKAALEPFRVNTPEREVPLLPYLEEPGPMLYDIDLYITMQPRESEHTSVISRTNYREMYYSAAQQLAHHTSSGCPMRTGDLLGSGTISGNQRNQCGSLLEISLGGKEPFTLDSGETRSFIEDGDTLGLFGAAIGNGFQIGFGPCTGRVV